MYTLRVAKKPSENSLLKTATELLTTGDKSPQEIVFADYFFHVLCGNTGQPFRDEHCGDGVKITTAIW